MLKLKVLDRSLCVMQVYAPNVSSKYQAFVDEVNDALLRLSPTESTVFMGEFNCIVFCRYSNFSGVIQPRSGVNICMKRRSGSAKVVNICLAKIFQIPSCSFVTLFMRVEVDLKNTLVTSLLPYCP